MNNIIYKDESFIIVGLCLEVYNNLGKGFLEIVYKDALEYELMRLNIPFKRENEFEINYKGIVLPHKFYADFIIYNKIILEIKSTKEINKEDISQTINYLNISKLKLGLLVNFGQSSLSYKRIVV